MKTFLSLLLASLVLPAAATDYYLIGNGDTQKQSISSFSGSSGCAGWASTATGTAKVSFNGSNGAVDPDGVYHMNGLSSFSVPSGYPNTYEANYKGVRLPAGAANANNDKSYVFPGHQLVFDGGFSFINDKLESNNDNAVFRVDNLLVKSGSHGEIRHGDDGNGQDRLKFLAGNRWEIENGGKLLVNLDGKGRRSFQCDATVVGQGTFGTGVGVGTVATFTSSNYGKVTFSGDLSAFEGVFVVMETSPAYSGTADTIQSAMPYLTTVIGSASAWPQSTPDGDVLLGSVVVTNGAKLAFACSVDSAEIRGWDFGTGAVPTVDVASGYTVRVFGPVSGTKGLNKTGAGTLVLNVGGEGAYDTITLSGSSTVSAATLSAYVAKCEQWLEDRNSAGSASAIFFY